MIALVDCNSFYASCEQAFRPDLQNKPVVVLSNNDGCIIAANKEAKLLTEIPMFQPIFKIRGLLDAHDVSYFSSNYTLYSDMSNRVMDTLRKFSPRVEEYSIDEGFVDLGSRNLNDYAMLASKIRDTVFKHTGIPVGVGIAQTKSLAKLANKFAKKSPERNGIFIVNDDDTRNYLLKNTKAEDIWGIGKKHAEKLKKCGVLNALDFTNLPVAWVRKEMTVIGERLWRELNGVSCLEFVTEPQTKKGIGTAKSFGNKLTDYALIEEACSFYVSEVADLLRQQGSAATQIEIGLKTNSHSAIDKQYQNKVLVTFESPTDSTMLLTKKALEALREIFKPGYRYKKVTVNLLQIVSKLEIQGSLFYAELKYQSSALTDVMDVINGKFGKNSVKMAKVGDREKEWALIKEHRSPRFTTQWAELLTIGAMKK